MMHIYIFQDETFQVHTYMVHRVASSVRAALTDLTELTAARTKKLS